MLYKNMAFILNKKTKCHVFVTLCVFCNDDFMRQYIEQKIIPLYDSFDKGHGREHVCRVIEQSIELSKYYDVNPNMVYAIAAYHDAGLTINRETHHLESGRIVRGDACLPQWFSAEEIEIMAQAVEDHRASSDHAPRSIYGKIVAEADRQIDGDTILRRAIQYGLANYPELDAEGHWLRVAAHLKEKYAEGGYLKLWIPESSNAARLQEFRRLLEKPDELRRKFDELFCAEKTQ